MNGPKPVCTSARKKMNQSRPRWLPRDGSGLTNGGGGNGKTLPCAADRPWRSPSVRSSDGDGSATRPLLLVYLCCSRQRFALVPGKTRQVPFRIPFYLSKSQGCRRPAAPSTMTGESSLYSGAADTCALVSSSVMLSRLLATPPKRSAPQSTTIFRLPTPRKPPKSI